MSNAPYDLDGQDLIDFYEAMEAHLSKMVDNRNKTIDKLYDKIEELRKALTTLLNDCEMILDGDDMSGMSDQQLFGAMKSTILSGLGMDDGLH